MRHAWPNVSVDYGPLTLMQGWIQNDPEVSKKTHSPCWSGLHPSVG